MPRLDLTAKILTTTAFISFSLILSAQAQSETLFSVDVPSQPLSSAIAELSRETGYSIAVNAEVLASEQSIAVAGEMSPRQALTRMLAGTTLTVTELADGSLIVIQNASDIPLVEGGSEIFTLDPITIQGQLRPSDLRSSPTSAVVVTGDEFDRRGDVDVYDVVERTANVTAIQGDRGFAIRGISQVGPGTGVSNGLTISTQVDGAALPTNISTILFRSSGWDLEQLEILRGPQSTQQGRNALAGAVIFKPNDPEFSQEFRLRGEVGSENLRRAALVANTPLTDILALRFTAEALGTDGFLDNEASSEDGDPRDYQSYRLALRLQPGDRFDGVLSYSYTDSERGGISALESQLPDLSQNFDTVERAEAINQIGRLEWSYQLNDILAVRSETSFLDVAYDAIRDADLGPLPITVTTDREDVQSFEHDLQLTFDTASVNGVVGFFYTKFDRDQNNNPMVDLGGFTSGVPNGFIVDLNTDFDTTNQNFALYGEAQIQAHQWVPGLSFTLGARYDYEEFEFDRTQLFTPIVPPGQSNNSSSGETSYEVFLPKFGVNYEFDPDQQVSLTYQRGYRAGGAQQNFGTGRLNQFDPEFTDNIELAYRGTFFGDSLSVRATSFYTAYTDQQVTVRNPNDFQDVDLVNAGESQIFGIELDTNWRLNSEWSLSGSLGLLKTEFTDFTSDDQSFTGKDLPFAPNVTAAFGVQYYLDDNWSVGADASFTDSYFSTPANSIEVDSRILTNAQVNWQNDRGWKAGAYIRNITDERYVTEAFAAPGDQVVQVGEPRTIGLFLELAF